MYVRMNKINSILFNILFYTIYYICMFPSTAQALTKEGAHALETEDKIEDLEEELSELSCSIFRLSDKVVQLV